MTSSKTRIITYDNPGEELSVILVKETILLLSGKWKIQIFIFLMKNGKARFMEVQRGVAGISSKILSGELQQMEQNKIVNRMVSDAKLTIVEYELTDHGNELEAVFFCIAQWGAEHLKILNN